MKPQCNTSADCLRELARVMDQFGIADTVDAVNSKHVKYDGISIGGPKWTDCPGFNHPKHWQFAIAEVEGKPVFVGDGTYDSTGMFETATSQWLPEDFIGRSWNPPKPATVMVELTVEDAEFYASETGWGCSKRTREACKTALEKLK